MAFTTAELESMRLADEKIDREFEDKYIADQTDQEISKWLDELAVVDTLDHKQLHQRKKRKEYSAAYYAEHKEEIAAKMAAYYAEHKEDLRIYMREYMREYRKKQRLKRSAEKREVTL